MEQTLNMLLPIVIVFVALDYTTAAATTKGELLALYPIKPQEYAALYKLIAQQPAISEKRIVDAGHRSLADWSNSMLNGWNGIFNLDRHFPGALVNEFGGYPLCVLKANDTIRRQKRSAEMNAFIHAGVAPVTVHAVHSYSENDYKQAGHETPVYGLPHSDPHLHEPLSHRPGQIIPLPSSDGDKQHEDASALVNCVVVLRRNENPSTTTSTTTTTTTTTPKPDTFPSGPGYPHRYPSPPPFFKFLPPLFGYPPYATPSLPAFDSPPSVKSYSLTPGATSRIVDATAMPEMDPASNAVFHQMFAEYYQQLAKLYVPQRTSEVPQGLLGSNDDQLSVPSVRFSVDDDEEMNYDDDDDVDDDDDNDKDNDNDSDVDVDEEYDDDSQDDDNENVDEVVDR